MQQQRPTSHEPSRREDVLARGARRLHDRPITAKRAATTIAAFTVLTAVAGGVLARIFDGEEFGSIGVALWWSLQTVTTVGYGDVVPRDVAGRIIGGVIMLVGLGFLAVVTAAVTAALIESTRRSPGGPSERELALQLTRISERLDAIEAALGTREGPGEPSG